MKTVMQWTLCLLLAFTALGAFAQDNKINGSDDETPVVTLVAVADASFPVIGNAAPTPLEKLAFGKRSAAWIASNPSYKLLLQGEVSGRASIGTAALAPYGEAGALWFKEYVRALYDALIQQRSPNADYPPNEFVFLISLTDYNLVLQQLERHE